MKPSFDLWCMSTCANVMWQNSKRLRFTFIHIFRNVEKEKKDHSLRVKKKLLCTNATFQSSVAQSRSYTCVWNMLSLTQVTLTWQDSLTTSYDFSLLLKTNFLCLNRLVFLSAKCSSTIKCCISIIFFQSCNTSKRKGRREIMHCKRRNQIGTWFSDDIGNKKY